MNNAATNTSKNISAAILMIALLIIEMNILDYLFPYPGFKAMILYSFIYGVCSAIIILGVFITKKLNAKTRITIWLIIFIVNSLLALQYYPQDGSPPVLTQITYTYNVISDYETISEEDLKLYVENEYDAFDKSVPDDEERYVAALYKYRNEIIRDGSNYIYGQTNKPILESTDIEKNLETGKDKLIWWILKSLNKQK